MYFFNHENSRESTPMTVNTQYVTYPGVSEAFSKQNDLRNHGRVRDDHSDGSEHGLQVVW